MFSIFWVIWLSQMGKQIPNSDSTKKNGKKGINLRKISHLKHTLKKRSTFGLWRRGG